MKNCLNPSIKTPELKASNCPIRPNKKVSTQAINVSIMIQIRSKSNLLIIRLILETGMVNKFFSVLSAYSLLNKYDVITPYKGTPINNIIYRFVSEKVSLNRIGTSGYFAFLAKDDIKQIKGAAAAPKMLTKNICERLSFNSSVYNKLTNRPAPYQFHEIVLETVFAHRNL